MKKQNLLLFLIIFLALGLRLYALDKFPVGLNADESAIGYNAYSLLKTGMDEHQASWPLVFRSFDDYKPPLYFYLVLPFIKFLGLTIYAVRLPSAILGIASVYGIYLLTRQLFNKNIAIFSTLFLAISPWHIHFSRGAWEVNVATFFTIFGIYAFFKSLNNPKFYYFSALSFVASLYTYHSMRLVTPLLILYLTSYLVSTRPTLRLKVNKHLIISLIIATILILPLAKQMFSSAGRSRFSGVSIFADQGPLWEALERRRNSPHPNSISTRLIHNKYLTYSRRFISNYLSHYSPRFLFVSGDKIARNKVPDAGQFYPLLAPFYFLGILSLLKLNTKSKKFVLFWFLVAPLASALTFQSPHALRSQNMAIPLTIIIAMGVSTFFEFFKKHKTALVVNGLLFVILLTYSTSHYLYKYYVRYPQELPFAWQFGFDKLAEYIQENGDQYDSIIISNRYDQPYIIMAFFLRYPPDQFQNEIKLKPRDKFGFSTVDAFGKFQFKKIDWSLDSKNNKSLIVVANEHVPADVQPIYQILYPNNKPVFTLYSTF